MVYRGGMAYDDSGEGSTIDPQTAEYLEDEGLQQAVIAEIDDAVNYIDEEISPQRAKATKYYRAEPFGNEQEGTSHHVSPDVRDTVLAMMPPLMRIFAGTERVVEYAPVAPKNPEEIQRVIAHAEQATDAIHHVFWKENRGFTVLYSAIKDALVRKTGILKWWYEDHETVTKHQHTGLDQEALAVLLDDPELEVVDLEGTPIEGATTMMPDGTPLPPELVPMTYDVTVERRVKKKKYCVSAVPPEEFLWNRKASSIYTSSIVAHRQELTVSALVEMGYDEDMVLEYASTAGDEMETNEERLTRNPELDSTDDTDRGDETAKMVPYVEAFIRYDLDGDGVAELIKVCTIGNGKKVVNVEPADDVPFAVLTPDPEPHLVAGLSAADMVMDVQETKSELWRVLLDSGSQSLRQRLVAVEGQVNMDDLLNNENGGVIRARAPGMVQALDTPFLGMQALPVIQAMDHAREERTGTTKAAQGLDSAAMQSSTKDAVRGTFAAANARVELIARVFAETGITDMFRGLLKLFIKHQDQPRMMRLRGQWVAVDPRYWNADMDVEINVALSAQTSEDKIAALAGIAEKQETIMRELGLDNPICSIPQYRNTLARMVELTGFKDAGQFFNEIPPDWTPPDEPEQKSPEEMLAEVQMKEIEANIQKKAAELQLDEMKARLADDRERDRIEADAVLRAADIEGKHGRPVDFDRIFALIHRDRAPEFEGNLQMPAQPNPGQFGNGQGGMPQ